MSIPDELRNIRNHLSRGAFGQREIWERQLERAACEIERRWRDAERYQYLRSRPDDTIGKGGLFAGMTPKTGRGGVILTDEDLDRAVDAALAGKP